MKTLDIKKWAVPAVVFAALVVWFFWVFRKTQSETSVLTKQLNGLRAETHKNIPEAQIQKVRLKADSLQGLLEQKQKRVFPEAEFKELGIRLGQIAGQYGMQIVSIRPDYDHLKEFLESNEAILDLPVQIRMKGTFPQLAKWLDNMNQFPFAVKIDDFFMDKELTTSLNLVIQLDGAVLMGKTKSVVRSDEKKPAVSQPPIQKEKSPS